MIGDWLFMSVFMFGLMEICHKSGLNLVNSGLSKSSSPISGSVLVDSDSRLVNWGTKLQCAKIPFPFFSRDLG